MVPLKTGTSIPKAEKIYRKALLLGYRIEISTDDEYAIHLQLTHAGFYGGPYIGSKNFNS